jgi:hypothetical protein
MRSTVRTIQAVDWSDTHDLDRVRRSGDKLEITVEVDVEGRWR